MRTFRIEIEGLVQGVGFRPFVYKLASSMNLEGSVENINTGVRVMINTQNGLLESFIERIRTEAPIQSHIESVNVNEDGFTAFKGFSIKRSNNLSDKVTRISPDIAVCEDCLTDMQGQEHRINYPLINCTNCGPRFSIITGLPYDRPKTTMADFKMCKLCHTEYDDVKDRRFHAQPLACNECGPRYSMKTDNSEIREITDVLKLAAEIIDGGGAIAVKGVGGYHMLCDAMNEDAVASLRKAKGRDSKPFAVMCSDISFVKKIARPEPPEIQALQSWQRPVIILKGRGKLASSVSGGLDTAGVILPYMPFHYLLFGKLKTKAIVFTSANLSDEPVITDDEQAFERLGQRTDAVVKYNRNIANRTDDSVGRLIAGKVRLARRSRGYTPTPVPVDFNVEGVYGAGAELSNCFAMGKGRDIILSQHIGDLKNAATLDFYSQAYLDFKDIFRFIPRLIACDMHPDYHSSVFAERMALKENIPLTRVQHHHAHIASCMTENRLNRKVIGVAMDGVGLGDDNMIWGGEFMIADLCGYKRVMHFDYVPIAGGDAVSYEPWRSGLSYLMKYIGEDSITEKLLPVKQAGFKKALFYTDLVNKEINTSSYSSAGRLFDAVAAITGLCYKANYHAEAPMMLESVADTSIDGGYGYDLSGEVISFGTAIRELVCDLEKGISTAEVSAKFHNCVAGAVADGVKYVFDISGIKDVVLSGGAFQNRYLAERIITKLEAGGFNVYCHQNVPVNDGGLALGQLAVAAARRDAGLI
ncbi:MAG: carbamoyltransferase HypF [Bacteroidales bacterium]|nr:carbamoyltransferase HypF [Bacteroidales bacterium]